MAHFFTGGPVEPRHRRPLGGRVKNTARVVTGRREVARELLVVADARRERGLGDLARENLVLDRACRE